MSGHSKWNNIKRRKGAADSARGKIFTKLGREIQVAVKSGGADPQANSSLKDAIARAKANNMPNDSIARSIAKASGADGNINYEIVIYEGYGPGGIAVMLRCMTENRNRTAGNVRHALDKNGGNLGTSGCVSYLFEEKGTLLLDREEYPDDEAVLMDALEAGAEDVRVDDESIEIVTAPDDYQQVTDRLTAKGYEFADLSLGPVPLTWMELSDPEQVEKMEKMLDQLDDDDDVMQVWHNWEH